MGENAAAAGEWPGPEVIWFWVEDLFAFIDQLKLAGYNIGTGEYLAAYHLVLALVGRGVDLRQPERLKTLLGPLLVSTPTEQEDFARRYDAWAGQVMAARKVAPAAPAAGPAQPINWRTTLIGCGVIIIALGLLIWLLVSLFNWATSAIGSLVAATPTLAPGQTATPAAANTLLGQPLELWYMLGAGVALFAVAAWFTRRWWWALLTSQNLEREASAEAPELSTLRLAAGPSPVLFPPLEYLHLSQGLRRRVEVPSRDLDVRRTLRRTLEKGGWFSPVYATRRVMPEYLVLIDRAGAKDHLARFVSEMVGLLRRYQVFISAYTFEGDPRVCLPLEGGLPKTLWEIISQGGQQRLILFSSAEGLFDRLTGELQPWNDLFNSIPQRALVTPVPVEHWGYAEQRLGERFQVLPLTAQPPAPGAQVLPLTTQGLAIFVKSLQGGEVFPPMPAQMTASLPDELRLRPQKWLSRSEPEPAAVEKMLTRLRRYLGPAGYLWLSACAIYPELHWELTLFLGNWLGQHPELVGEADGEMFSARRLVDLARLPWLREGSLPDWLRLRLIDGLSKTQERAIRTELLTHLDPQKGELALQIATRPGHARAHLRALAAHAEPGQPLQDYVFLSFMLGSNPNRLAVRLPERVRRYLADRRRPQDRPRSALFTPANLRAMGTWVLLSAMGAGLGSLLGSAVSTAVVSVFGLVFAALFQALWLADRYYRPSPPAQSTNSSPRSGWLARMVAARGLIAAWLAASLTAAVLSTYLTNIIGSGAIGLCLFFGLAQWVVLARFFRRTVIWWVACLAGAVPWLIFATGLRSGATAGLEYVAAMVYFGMSLVTAPIMIRLLESRDAPPAATWGQPYEGAWRARPGWPAALFQFAGVWFAALFTWAAVYYLFLYGLLNSIFGYPTISGQTSSTTRVLLLIGSAGVYLIEWLVLARYAGVGIDWLWAGLGGALVANWLFNYLPGLSSYSVLNLQLLNNLLSGLCVSLPQARVLRKVSARWWVWLVAPVSYAMLVTVISVFTSVLSGLSGFTNRLLYESFYGLVLGIILLPVFRPQKSRVENTGSAAVSKAAQTSTAPAARDVVSVGQRSAALRSAALKLDKTDYDRLVEILVGMSQFLTETGRVDLVRSAMKGSLIEDKIMMNLNLSGTVGSTATGLVEELCQMGRISPNQEALGLLVRYLIDYIFGAGDENTIFLKGLIERYNLEQPGLVRLPASTRPLYPWEIEEFRPVFGDGLDYTRVRVHENNAFPDSIDRLGRILKRMPAAQPSQHNAITLGNGCYFPVQLPVAPLDLNDTEFYKLPWLCHELTHAWQFQHQGWLYLIRSLLAQFSGAGYNYGGEAGLILALQHGRHLSDFNHEQQGDIARDYYWGLRRGQDMTAYLPFIDELQGRKPRDYSAKGPSKTPLPR